MIDSMPHHNPMSGILSIPCAGLRNRQNLGMRPKEILADNLNRLMQARPHLATNLKIVAQSGGRLSNGKLGRIRLGGKTDIETIGELAEVFEVEPWQLLVEDLDPKALPQLTTTPLVEQIRKLVSIPQSWDGVNPDRAGKHPTKVLSSMENSPPGYALSPALEKFFSSTKGSDYGVAVPPAKSKKRHGDSS